MESVHTMALGRTHDAGAGVPALPVVNVTAGELHANTILVEDRRQAFVVLVLRRIEDIIIGIVQVMYQ